MAELAAQHRWATPDWLEPVRNAYSYGGTLTYFTLFMCAGGMVVDMGGAMSHAAIVARELGVPCVINTGNGTSLIPDGATIRLDGTTGTVDPRPRVRRVPIGV